MIRIAIKLIDNKPYIDKDFINIRGVEKLSIYGYSVVEIDDKYFDCEASDFDGLNFNVEKYNQRKTKADNQNKIQNNLIRMDELSKDFIQAYLGASIPNLDIKKQEFVRLHNEVRTLQGKEPRVYYLS